MRVPKKILKEGNILEFYQDGKNINSQNIILPTGEFDEKQSRREISEYIARTVKEPELQKKTIERFEELFAKVIQYGGTVSPLWSTGGSKENRINKDLLDYVEIKLNGVVVLEPIGQINNAMYILKDDENLREKYKKTRMQLAKDPTVFKISHEANKAYNSYNFDGVGILQVIDAINNNKQAFMSAVTPQNLYSNITRVMNDYYSKEYDNDEER